MENLSLSVLCFLVLGIAEMCEATTQCTKGPCGPDNELCASPGAGNVQSYTFHLADKTCAINDPNFPFYDEVHGVYHLMYQDHLAIPSPVGLGKGRGPDIGHWVSKDFLHWAHLQVSIWNDKWYDNAAIFTGSTTIVDGKPVIIYPGKCAGSPGSPEGDACKSGFTYDVAVPANASDPLYTQWTKPSYNPIVNNTGDDPSTAWKTDQGEWRLIGNQGCFMANGTKAGAPMYGSMDFKSWYKIGCTELKLGDCPTFFPLPSFYPGSDKDSGSATMPNYVHKAGSGNDQVQIGTWADGAAGPTDSIAGSWTQVGESTPLDNGKTHASKDFWDPVRKRRIMWVWGTVPNGIQTIPRHMTYDPRFGKIVYTPVEEMKQLRGDTPIDMIDNGGWSTTMKASTASDIEVFFQRPASAATLFVNISSSTCVYLKFLPDADTAECGIIASGATSRDTISMLKSDDHVAFRVFIDATVIEAYWQDGRVAMTNVFPSQADKDVQLTIGGNNANIKLKNATSWQMSSIYVTKQEVLAAPRLPKPFA